MPSETEILAAAKAMILVCKERRDNGGPMPSRTEEAAVALKAAELVRSAAFRPTSATKTETFLDEGSGGNTEVDVSVGTDGVIKVTDIRTWKHEIDG